MSQMSHQMSLLEYFEWGKWIMDYGIFRLRPTLKTRRKSWVQRTHCVNQMPTQAVLDLRSRYLTELAIYCELNYGTKGGSIRTNQQIGLHNPWFSFEPFSIKCVLLCFIKPILRNRYSTKVSSRASQGDAPTIRDRRHPSSPCPPLDSDSLGCPEPHPEP